MKLQRSAKQNEKRAESKPRSKRQASSFRRDDPFHQMVAEISAELNFSKVLIRIVQGGMRLLGLDSGGIALWDEERRCFVLRAVQNMPAGFEGLEFQSTGGITGTVFLTGKTTVEESSTPFAPETFTTKSYRAAVGTPLRIGERVVGSLNLQTASLKKKISEEDRLLLEEWGKHASIAIGNADTFHTLQGMVLELEKKAQGATQESEALRERLVRKEKLAALGQIVGSVNHELRQPLEVITNAVYYLKALLERNDVGGVKKDFERFLNIISEECVNTTDLVNELLHFTRKKEVVPLGVDLNKLLESILLKMHVPNKVKVKRRFTPNLPMIYADPVQLSRAFYNILINAIQAMPKGGGLDLSTDASRESVDLVIQDSGVGISPEHIKKIFEPLFTTKTKGIGLGLSLVKEYIESNRGQMKVQSEEGVGTTVQISFPFLPPHQSERP
jgi:signal transduction histidine kinase